MGRRERGIFPERLYGFELAREEGAVASGEGVNPMLIAGCPSLDTPADVGVWMSEMPEFVDGAVDAEWVEMEETAETAEEDMRLPS